jgi:hypothetical protein
VSSDLSQVRSRVRTPVEEAPIVIPSVRRSRHHWVVVLAGGDGTRLQSLTLKIAGVMDILARNKIQPAWLRDGQDLLEDR